MTISIPVVRDPRIEFPLEHCVFCDVDTTWWTALPDRADGEQVACCPACARERDRAEVPSKAAWCAEEERRHPWLRRKVL